MAFHRLLPLSPGSRKGTAHLSSPSAGFSRQGRQQLKKRTGSYRREIRYQADRIPLRVLSLGLSWLKSQPPRDVTAQPCREKTSYQTGIHDTGGPSWVACLEVVQTTRVQSCKEHAPKNLVRSSIVMLGCTKGPSVPPRLRKGNSIISVLDSPPGVVQNYKHNGSAKPGIWAGRGSAQPAHASVPPQKDKSDPEVNPKVRLRV